MKPGVSQLVPKKAQVMTSSFQARGYFSEYFKGVSNVGAACLAQQRPELQRLGHPQSPSDNLYFSYG